MFFFIKTPFICIIETLWDICFPLHLRFCLFDCLYQMVGIHVKLSEKWFLTMEGSYLIIFLQPATLLEAMVHWSHHHSQLSPCGMTSRSFRTSIYGKNWCPYRLNPNVRLPCRNSYIHFFGNVSFSSIHCIHIFFLFVFWEWGNNYLFALEWIHCLTLKMHDSMDLLFLTLEWKWWNCT